MGYSQCVIICTGIFPTSYPTSYQQLQFITILMHIALGFLFYFKGADNMENVNNNNNLMGDNNSNSNVSSHNNNSFNTNNITNIYPRSQSKKERDKEREQKQRPYLADKEGKLVKGYGYIVRQYKGGMYTVINLTDLNGVYMADHIQMFIEEDKYKYVFKSNFIQFEGNCYKYKRNNGTNDYSIKITKPVKFLDDEVMNCNYTERYFDMELDYNKFLKYFYKAEYNDLFRLLNKLSERLDKLTIEFGKRFVYNNIINNFMLYNATYDLYNEELQTNIINMEGLISLILITASTIFKIEVNEYLNIGNTLSYVAYVCNLEQGVISYDKHSKSFENFCSNMNISGKKLKKAWNIIGLRKYNFGTEPNPNNVSKNELAEYAYYVLNDYI